MRNIVRCGAWLVLVCLLLGCSSTPGRDSLLQELKPKLERKKSLLVYLGRLGLHCSSVVASPIPNTPDETEDNMDMNPTNDIDAVVASKAGYITVTSDGKDHWQVQVSEKGLAYLKAQKVEPYEQHFKKQNGDCGSGFVSFPVAAVEVLEVTGVTAVAEGATACQADFAWRWVPTELGKALQENGSLYLQLSPKERAMLAQSFKNVLDPEFSVPIPVPPDWMRNQGTATFRKYDDGWRMK